MKKVFALLLVSILTITTVFAQETTKKSYQFGNITGIDAGYVYVVNVTQGNSDKIEVVCPSYLQEYMDIKAFNGILYLKMNLPVNFRHPKNNSQSIAVHLQMKTINSINLSGASSFSAQGEFTTDHLECDLSGASKLSKLNISGKYLDMECSGATNVTQTGNFTKLDLDCSGASKVSLNGNIDEISFEASGATSFTYSGNSRNIDAEASGASKATFIGKCESIKIDCSGASYINAKDMITNNAAAGATGASKVAVYSSGTLKADASTSSTISYYGNPKQIISKPNNIRKAD